MAWARVSWASLDRAPCDMAPVEKRLAMVEAGSTSFQGTVKGGVISWVMNVATPQGDISVQMDGEVEGDTIKGTFDFGQGTGTWVGKKTR